MSLFTTYLPYFVLELTLLVFVHEYGHYWVGRRFGIHAEVFSIGFGPELIGWTDRNGTRWKISAIPLGGYVKFAGDVNATSAPDPETLARLTPAERAVSFHHKSVGKRAAIVAAGPIANFLLAILVFAGIAFISGRYVLAPRIDAVQAGS